MNILIPMWMAYLAYVALSIAVISVALTIIYFIGDKILDSLIPKLFYWWNVLRIRGMNEEQFYRYIDALCGEWQQQKDKRKGKFEDEK